MKVVKEELLDNRMEESGIFLICDLGRQADYDKFCFGRVEAEQVG